MATQIQRLQQIQENIDALKENSVRMTNVKIRNNEQPALKLNDPAENTTGGSNYNILATNALKENGYDITKNGFIIDTKSKGTGHITSEEQIDKVNQILGNVTEKAYTDIVARVMREPSDKNNMFVNLVNQFVQSIIDFIKSDTNKFLEQQLINQADQKLQSGQSQTSTSFKKPETVSPVFKVAPTDPSTTKSSSQRTKSIQDAHKSLEESKDNTNTQQQAIKSEAKVEPKKEANKGHSNSM